MRGTSADLSSVTINGNRVPSAEGDTRNVQLDLIPADMIQTIEVNKVVTADMDGDAIGGSINLVTKNSPYKRTIAATAGTGYNWVSEKAQLNLGFTYGDRFFNDKLGLIVSASYQNSPSGSYDTEFVWEQDDNGKTYVNDYQIRQYYVTRERQSYSAALDWDINANHKLTFKGIFNNRNDWENRYRTTLKDLDPDGNAPYAYRPKPVRRTTVTPAWNASAPWTLPSAANTSSAPSPWLARQLCQSQRRTSQRTLHRLPTEETEVRHGPERRTPTLCQPQNRLYHDIER